MFNLKNASISIAATPIIKKIDLTIKEKELHVLMGPNGSGKSTLSLALAGHAAYEWGEQSQANLDGKDLLRLPPNERAKAGLFLSFQHPVAVPGISVQQLLKTMVEHLRPNDHQPIASLRQQMMEYCEILHIKTDFLSRSINEGFSGGEQKRLEMLQLLMAKPKLAILDEIDSGLDVDAIKTIAAAVGFAQAKFHTSFLVVTHYRRIIDQLKPDKVHILVKGELVQSGNLNLINQIEDQGYAAFIKQS